VLQKSPQVPRTRPPYPSQSRQHVVDAVGFTRRPEEPAPEFGPMGRTTRIGPTRQTSTKAIVARGWPPLGDGVGLAARSPWESTLAGLGMRGPRGRRPGGSLEPGRRTGCRHGGGNPPRAFSCDLRAGMAQSAPDRGSVTSLLLHRAGGSSGHNCIRVRVGVTSIPT